MEPDETNEEERRIREGEGERQGRLSRNTWSEFGGVKAKEGLQKGTWRLEPGFPFEGLKALARPAAWAKKK